jgi:hypothetical protein
LSVGLHMALIAGARQFCRNGGALYSDRFGALPRE